MEHEKLENHKKTLNARKGSLKPDPDRHFVRSRSRTPRMDVKQQIKRTLPGKSPNTARNSINYVTGPCHIRNSTPNFKPNKTERPKRKQDFINIIVPVNS